MQRVIFRYGLFAAGFIVLFSSIEFFILKPYLSMNAQEVGGYLTIALSMIFVFMGIRHFRDRVNQGRLSFGEGMKIGTLIVLIPSVFFGLFDILYTEVINPAWRDEYILQKKKLIEMSLPVADRPEKLKDLQSTMDMFSNPVIQFLLMAATVFIIGLIVTIISSLTLRTKSKTELVHP